jgi:hypothetical protein
VGATSCRCSEAGLRSGTAMDAWLGERAARAFREQLRALVEPLGLDRSALTGN